MPAATPGRCFVFKFCQCSLALLLIFLASCASSSAKKPRAVAVAPAPVEEWKPYQTGVASWYGGRWAYRKTACGERYNPNSMTAAHRKLPFGTMVRVTNLNNGRSCVVRINNRGPFVRGRVIDLSVAAAKQ